jgi:hypothetical protein
MAMRSAAAANCEAASAFAVAQRRQQAYDHLQVVQESMVGLAARERLILNRLIFLTKQVLIKSDDLSQLEFGPPMSFQFAFIACCRAVLRATIWGI